jgi:hypothetical protein
MSVRITDPDAFEKMTAVEGERWARYTTQRRATENFFHVKESYCEAVCMLKKVGQDPVAGRATELMEGNVIYGDAGYARYIVQNSGEIVLDGRTTRPERVQQAKAVGFRVI